MLAALPSLDALLLQATDAYGRTLGIDPKTGKPIPDPYPPPTPSVDASPSDQASAISAAKKITQAASAGTDYLKQLERWAAGIATRDKASGEGGVSLEDLIFIALGVLLIAAAVFSFVFTFKETQQVVKGATKAARGAVDSKLAAALVA